MTQNDWVYIDFCVRLTPSEILHNINIPYTHLIGTIFDWRIKQNIYMECYTVHSREYGNKNLVPFAGKANDFCYTNKRAKMYFNLGTAIRNGLYISDKDLKRRTSKYQISARQSRQIFTCTQEGIQADFEQVSEHRWRPDAQFLRRRFREFARSQQNRKKEIRPKSYGQFRGLERFYSIS